MNDGTRVFGVSCHVDYWYSAPADPLIDAYCTERQGMYASAWQAEYIYTPQIVVNGLETFENAGSEGTTLNGVNAGLARDITTGVTAWLHSEPTDAPLLVEIQVLDPPDDFELVVTVVERDIDHDVTGGENAGQTLHHDNVWRTIEILTNETTPELSLDLPDDAIRENCSIIAWVQDIGSLEIVGATQTHLFE
jgi:hypothetical protein